MVVEDKTHYVYLLLWAGRKLHTLTGGGCAFKASRLLQLVRYGDVPSGKARAIQKVLATSMK